MQKQLVKIIEQILNAMLKYEPIRNARMTLLNDGLSFGVPKIYFKIK
jgi:hypothetical protein